MAHEAFTLLVKILMYEDFLSYYFAFELTAHVINYGAFRMPTILVEKL